MAIHYEAGDATKPKTPGPKLIVHICNDIGAWGRGFVMALSKRWPEPEQRYRAWYRGEENQPFALGRVQFVQITADIWVANLIGQQGIRTKGGIPPIRYQAVREGLEQVAAEALRLNASVHMPRIGCGLAGGTWEEIEPLVETQLAAKGIAVTVYDLPAPRGPGG